MNRKNTSKNKEKTFAVSVSVLAVASFLTLSEIERRDLAVEVQKSEQEVVKMRESYENLSLKIETITHESIMLEKLKNKQLTEMKDSVTQYQKVVEQQKKELLDNKSKIESLESELARVKKNKEVAKKSVAKSPASVKKSEPQKNSEPEQVAEPKQEAKTETVTTGYEGWTKMNVEATGYSLFSDELGGNGDGVTATGTVPTAGRTIAVDPTVIPYGTQVYIPAMGGTYIAEDTGGMIKGNKIDIYMSHGDIARQWGRQTIEVYVNY